MPSPEARAAADSRPDPDRLLTAVQAEEARARRGRLRIFFGACAGVGKTYAMLQFARTAAAGKDVVVGYVEPHGRSETEALLDGLEQLSPLPVAYRGITRQEFDLDAALRRRPAILLVDELAHSNLTDGEPRPRHAKRWQDVAELLDAGIDVWTTVNVQHLESLNDVVAGITGVRQQETIPDRVFDEADEVELIDLPADDLLERLRQGKIYLPQQVVTAVERFFRKGNLIALRELALRRTADRVDASARELGATERGSRPWLARDRLIAALGPGAGSEQLVRSAKRLADGLDAEWTVVYVETPALRRMTEAQRNRRVELLRLAESLGAETVTLDGPTVADALLEYLATRNATRVLVGAPSRQGPLRWLRRSLAAELVARAPGVDILVIGRADAGPVETRPFPAADPSGRDPDWGRYALALGGTAACTLVAAAMFPYFELVNIVMVYLLGSAVIGLRLGRGPAIAAALANVMAFDFCFVPPRFTFAVGDVEYFVTFAVMLAVSLIVAQLMASVRQQTRVAGARERRTALLYAMGRELASTRGSGQMAAVAIRHVSEVFASRTAVLLPGPEGRLQRPLPAGSVVAGFEADLSVAQWVMDHGRSAGLGTDTLPGAPAVYVPLPGTGGPLGVLAVLPSNRRRILLPEQRALLDTFAGTIGLALERATLGEAAETARVAAEAEGIRNTLLASISHDLRTPLAAIAGAAGALRSQASRLPEPQRAQLAQTIEATARRMADTIANVLELSRLEAGGLALQPAEQSLHELVGTAVGALASRLVTHHVDVHVPGDLPALRVDGPLIVRLLQNLLENALTHTPAGTRVTVTAAAAGSGVTIDVADDGPGLPPGDAERLFGKFQRGRDEGATPGVGLGLAICREIARLHGGNVVAMVRPGGGALFRVTLPVAVLAGGRT
ncbi:MAG: sensor histidine kinase KdpD [Chromatiales bacterium]|jgi:two-component system sensor histidine kinase KdpD|nr:sensor histidine kinase KdpD [Chromatiales bacterium]